MFDTHYDLLTIAYMAYTTGNYSYLEQISKYFHDNNVTGVIANLYFMSLEEMKEELGEKYYQEDVSVLEMFKIAKKILDTYLGDIDIVYSIEGFDFVKDCDELEKLYNEGLDSFILCWNTENKYGSGNRSNKGLTDEGRKIINKAIDLGMGIDLSHANKETFYDLVNLIKERQAEGTEVCCYASHSNSIELCDRDRNLDDDQLRHLKEIGALVGVFSNKNFIVKPDVIKSDTDFRKEYMRHIDHIMSIVGPSNVTVATDDMDFLVENCPDYSDLSIYEYASVGKTLLKDLTEKYDENVSIGLLYDNAKNRIYDRLKNNRKERSRGVTI